MKINKWDLAVLAFALIFSGFYFLSRLYYGYPLVKIGGDAANIASFAAAYDAPAHFQGDALLSNLDNIRIYYTIHIPLIRWLKGLVGNYGLGFQLLLGPTILLQILAFYFLGRVWFNSRYWAFLFSALNLVGFQLVLQEGWGIFGEPVPRFTFQALLPLILALVWIWRDRPRLWPVIMAFTGALVYVHPVSTPAWLAAILFGFWYLMPAGWRFFKRLAALAGLAAVSIVVMVPFILNYMSYHVQGKVVNYGLLMLILRSYFPENLLNPPAALLQFIEETTLSGLLPLSLAGFVLVWILLRGERKKLILALFWMAGLALVALFIPSVERIVERIFRIAPFETELMRGIRYFLLFMELFMIWPLSELSRRLKDSWQARAVMAAGLLLVILYLPRMYEPSYAPTLACLGQGKLLCGQEAGLDDVDQLIQAVQEKTPPEARIYFSRSAYDSGPLYIRYLALRSLVYNYKDRGLLAYSNTAELEKWYEAFKKVSRYKSDLIWLETQPDRLTDFLVEYKVDYFVIAGPVTQDLIAFQPYEIVYQNDSYTLLKMHPENLR